MRKLKIAGLYPQEVSRGPQGEIEYFEPLGLEYVLSQVQEHQVKLFTFFKNTRENLIKDILDFSPDVLIVSAMTCQINLGLSIARELKKKAPGIITVFGGYHPNFDPSLELCT